MPSRVEQIAALVIGTVESVAPSEIRVLLDLDAPQATALNAGTPQAFPRLNGYVLIPSEAGAVVGVIRWLGVEKSPFPRRSGLRDFGIVDLPYPLRKMAVAPLGVLANEAPNSTVLRRGIPVFPSVGDQVLLPSAAQVAAIVEAHGADRRVPIGKSPLAAGVSVTVDPDKVFGRHLAVLGNTGSGKSCTVAGLVRWSIQAAEGERRRIGREGKANARFIVLDPNAEYLQAFASLPGGVRVFRVPPVSSPAVPLSVPGWLWNSHEWSSFAHAAPGTQRPLLMQALRELRAGATLADSANVNARRFVRSYVASLKERVANGIALMKWQETKALGQLLTNMADDADLHASRTEPPLSDQLSALSGRIQTVIQKQTWHGSGGKTGFNEFSESTVAGVIDEARKVLDLLTEEEEPTEVSEDAPREFRVLDLPEHLDQIAAREGAQMAQFVAALTLRIRTLISDPRLAPVVDISGQSFDDWLGQIIGEDGAANGQVAVIDLSLVPADVIHIVVAVIGRIVFEALQRHRKLTGGVLPTILVLEEAHTFVQKRLAQEEGHLTPALMCRQTFERISREGRKFGLGLVMSSQRPAELSETVLAQCNTFILHRLVNDRDQELVGRMVPDQVAGLLAELPSLPTRRAVLLGWAAPFPALVDIGELPEDCRPRSADAEFWRVWTGEASATTDWKAVVRDWSK